MNELQIYNHPDFGKVRIIMINGEPYFVGRDVAIALGYSNPNDALAKHVPDKYKLVSQIAIAGQMRNVTLINEAGLYKLVMRSKLPNAEKFSDWVCEEVLPSIRKHGMYLDPNAPIDPRFLRRIADEIEARDKKILELDTQVTTLSNENAEMKPKVDYYEKVMSSEETLSTTLIAHAYGMSAIIFNRKLEELKIIRKVNNVWELYQKYVGKGYMVDVVRELKDGFTVTHNYWTHKGRMFLYSELKKHGIFPTREQNSPQLALFEGDVS